MVFYHEIQNEGAGIKTNYNGGIPKINQLISFLHKEKKNLLRSSRDPSLIITYICKHDIFISSK